MGVEKKKIIRIGSILVVVGLAFCFGSHLILPRMFGGEQIIPLVTAADLYLFFSIAGFGLIFGLVTILPIRNSVASRLDNMSIQVTDIRSQGNFTARIPVTGSDVIARIAFDVNKLLAAVQLSHQKKEQENKDLRKNVVVLKALAEIDREIIAKSESRSIIDLVCGRAPSLLGVPMAAVILREKPDRFIASFGLQSPGLFKTVNADFFQTVKGVGIDCRHGIYSFTGDAIDDLLTAEFRANENIRAVAVALLTVEKHILGALLVFDRQPRAWKGDDVQFLSLLAGRTALALDSTRLYEEKEMRSQELSALYDLSRDLADANPDTESILKLVTTHAVEKVHVTYARIALFEDDVFSIKSANPVRMLGRDLHVPISDPTSVSFLKKVLEQDQILVLRHDQIGFTDREMHELMLDKAQLLCLVPLKTEKGARGVLMLGEERREDREPFTEEKKRLAANIGNQTVSALHRVELFEELAGAYLETVMALANAVDVKDTYTGDHGGRLAEMALAIGERLELAARELKDLHYASILHDIGKIGIPDAILQKPARLNDEEFRCIQTHSILGEQILEPVTSLVGAAKMVRHHHERYDGGGYPDGISGNEIPVGARILTVVDSFCAIIDKRSYKPPRTVGEAILEMKKCSGGQFDPQIVQILISLLNDGNISIPEAA